MCWREIDFPLHVDQSVSLVVRAFAFDLSVYLSVYLSVSLCVFRCNARHAEEMDAC